jgi:cell division septation protein DedD
MATQEEGRFTLKALRRDGPPKKFTLELSLGGLVTLGVAVIIGLVWVFIFGIIVGRGYRPEQAVPEIAKIMPDSGRAPIAAEPPKVLQPEELNFHEALRRDPPVLPSEITPMERAPERQANRDAPLAIAPVPQASAQDASAAKAPQSQWVYQAASFKDKGQAESLLRKIMAQGVATSLEKAPVNGVTWYRVLVTIKGSERDNEAALAELSKIGLPKPLLRKHSAL